MLYTNRQTTAIFTRIYSLMICLYCTTLYEFSFLNMTTWQSLGMQSHIPFR